MEEIKDIDYDDDIDFNFEGDEEFTEEEEELSNELFNLISGLAEDTFLVNEEFVSRKALENHYDIHCLANYKNRWSSEKQVFYDFRNIDKYRYYEDEVSKKFNEPDFSIATLNDYNHVIKSMRKLFEGNKTVKFEISCGIKNNFGSISIGLHSFASDKTSNYKKGNTINVLVMARKGKTISMYPTDSYQLERRLNMIVKKYARYNGIKFKFND